MEDSKEVFIAQSLRTLQVQINRLTLSVEKLEETITTLTTGWDSPSFKISRMEYALGQVAKELAYLIPVDHEDEIIIKDAAGRIVSKTPEQQDEDGN